MRVLVALLFFCGFMTSAFAQLEPIHTGDVLQITVWQDPKLDRKVVVGPDGMISFPLAGHIRAAGMTTKSLEDALKSRLQKSYSGDLDITISLGDINKEAEAESKPRIYITGEVQKPGPYVLRAGTDVVQALVQAGGLGIFAAPQRIQIHRKVQGADSIFVFDYNAYQAGTIASDNIHLRAGDIIIVPERGLFE